MKENQVVNDLKGEKKAQQQTEQQEEYRTNRALRAYTVTKAIKGAVSLPAALSSSVIHSASHSRLALLYCPPLPLLPCPPV